MLVVKRTPVVYVPKSFRLLGAPLFDTLVILLFREYHV